MDPRNFVEGFFDGHLLIIPQFKFFNQLFSLNDVPIPSDLSRMGFDDANGRSNPINLDDIDEDASEAKLQISSTRRKQKQKKATTCWEQFKLISTGCNIDSSPRV